jgi:hypothetical protein
MNKLAPELLDAVIELLDRSDLRRCCTVSRRWQFSVERLTFRDIRLKSTDLERFSDIFSDHRRREVLGAIEYHVILPRYSEKRRRKYERAKDKKANNEAFTEAFHGLFGILHAWEHDQGATTPNQKTITLDCSVYSPTDKPEDIFSYRSEIEFGVTDLFSRRHEYFFLRLLKDDLPNVSRISCFQLLPGLRRVEGTAVAAIVAKLPNLESIDWELNDNDNLFPSLRQQRRYGNRPFFFFFFFENATQASDEHVD